MDRLAAMEAFVLVTNMGSFSAAARRLDVGSRRSRRSWRNFEDHLGVKLLVRDEHTGSPRLKRDSITTTGRGAR